MQHPQDIVSVEETSIPFPEDICACQYFTWTPHFRELTHRNTKQAYKNLNASDSHKGIRDTALGEPVVGAERKAEAEDILEYHHASKCLDCNISYSNGEYSNIATGVLGNYDEHRRCIEH